MTPGTPTIIQFDVINGREKRVRVEIDLTGDGEVDFKGQSRPLIGSVGPGVRFPSFFFFFFCLIFWFFWFFFWLTDTFFSCSKKNRLWASLAPLPLRVMLRSTGSSRRRLSKVPNSYIICFVAKRKSNQKKKKKWKKKEREEEIEEKEEVFLLFIFFHFHEKCRQCWPRRSCRVC